MSLSMRHERAQRKASSSFSILHFHNLHLPHCQMPALLLLAENFPFFIAYAVRSRTSIHSVSSSKMHFASLVAVVVVRHPQTRTPFLFMPFLFYFQPSTHSTLAPCLSAPSCIARFLCLNRFLRVFFLHTRICV